MSSVTESNLGLNYGWAYGESGWNTGMDDNLVKLGFTSRNQVKGVLSAPPSTLSNGDAYIVGISPTGLFSGNFGKVAIWDRTGWLFLTPKNHEVVYNVADGCDYKYDNGWVLKQEDELSPYVKVKDFTFSTGYTITDQRQCLLNLADNKYYQWFGALPKVIAAGSTPSTAGGVGAGAWVDRTDVTLRDEIANSAEIIGFDDGLNVGGSSNKVNIDILVKRESVNLLRGIPFSEWDAVKNGTSSLDVSSVVQNAVNYCASNNAKLHLPHGKLNFSNILLPSTGIDIEGVNTFQTKIHNSSLTTPIFYTATGRNLWIELHGFTLVGKNLATGADIAIQDFEHLSLNDINITTDSGERTGAAGILLFRSSPSRPGYYLCTEQVKVDKHQYGIKLLGVSGANLNSNGVRGAVTNDNTNAGIRADFCSGLRIKDGSAELNKNNIEIYDSTGVIVSGYYMERPQTHGIQIVRGNLCKVIENPVISSSGAGASHNGSVVDSTGRGVYIQESIGVDVSGNNFINPWSFYDVEVASSSAACAITDNRKRHRTDGYTRYKVEVLDSASDTTIRNYEKTPGGSTFMFDYSSVTSLAGEIQTRAGKELSISGSSVKLYSGAGSPEGVVTASRGSLYLRNNGGAGYTFYVKETGDGLNTGWVAK